MSGITRVGITRELLIVLLSPAGVGIISDHDRMILQRQIENHYKQALSHSKFDVLNIDEKKHYALLDIKICIFGKNYLNKDEFRKYNYYNGMIFPSSSREIMLHDPDIIPDSSREIMLHDPNIFPSSLIKDDPDIFPSSLIKDDPEIEKIIKQVEKKSKKGLLISIIIAAIVIITIILLIFGTIVAIIITPIFGSIIYMSNTQTMLGFDNISSIEEFEKFLNDNKNRMFSRPTYIDKNGKKTKGKPCDIWRYNRDKIIKKGMQVYGIGKNKLMRQSEGVKILNSKCKKHSWRKLDREKIKKYAKIKRKKISPLQKFKRKMKKIKSL
jgi:hypothetical protein